MKTWLLAPHNKRQRTRGVGIMIVLFVVLILFSLLKAVSLLSHHDAFASQKSYEQTVARSVLDSAVEHCLAEIDEDPNWTQGFDNNPMPGGDGTYSVVFVTPGTRPTGDQSVNNLEGATEVPGASGTIPPGMAELVVIAEFRGRRLKTRLAIGRDLNDPIQQLALGSSGRVLLKGDVDVDALPVDVGVVPEANIHSNLADATSDLVTWRPDSLGDRANVAGKVSSASPVASAIDFSASANVDNGFENGAPQIPLREIDVAGRVAANTSLPSPTIPPLGTATISDNSYNNSGLSINGDLALRDATLYVDGDLDVNGSITGEGAIYVSGDVNFSGDARVFTNNDEGVALFSAGNVRLSGFDGSAFLDTLITGDAEAETALEDAQAAMREVQNVVNANPSDQLTLAGNRDNFYYLRDLARILGQDTDSAGRWEGRTNDATGVLLDRLQSSPQSKTRDFLIRRLDFFERMFADPGQNYYRSTRGEDTLQDWLNQDNSLYGYFVGLTAFGDEEALGQLREAVNALDYDRPGSSYFRGFVYSRGSILAENEVNIVGSLQAVGQEGVAAQTGPGNERLEPGDICLANGVQLKMNKEFEQRAFGGAGQFKVTARLPE